MILAVGGVLDPHGPVAATIEDLWWVLLWLGVAAFVVFAVLLAVGLLRTPPEDADAEAGKGTIRRWIGWGGVVFPTVVIIATLVVTLVAMRATPDVAPPDALQVEIIGHQFYYEVVYPASGVILTDELRLPVGRPVALQLRSEDVIHSFWVPELAGKLDLLPGRVNTLVLEADRPGVFISRCAEFCGLLHAQMDMEVIVDPAEEFDAWLREEQARTASATADA